MLPARDDRQLRRSLRDEAHSLIRQLIVDGTLAPGERLRDGDLAAWLGISRTPVREALAKLVEERLVELAPNRFTRVSSFGADDAKDTFPVAAALHGLATELAARSAERAALEGMRTDAERFTWALWRSDAREAIAADEAFHRRLIELAGNRSLADTIERLMPNLRRLELATWADIAAERADGHGPVLEALGQGDVDSAATLAVEEWRALGRSVERALRSADRHRQDSRAG